MSSNSGHYNDENLLEISNRRTAAICLAGFLRHRGHYRARATGIKAQRRHRTVRPADRYHKGGSPEQKTRLTPAPDACEA